MLSQPAGVEDIAQYTTGLLERSRAALPALTRLRTELKDRALEAMADAVWAARSAILEANAHDVQAARAARTEATRIDRLLLDEERIAAIADGMRAVAKLPDPVGQVIREDVRPNGLRIAKLRVPIGVVAVVYESRPNVTADAAAISFKTGNAVVLRGGREALASNTALAGAMRHALADCGLPIDAIQLIERPERATVDLLIRARGLVDLAIPRGGAGLIDYVTEHALVPVIETGVGNCHVYVDRAADLGMADAIVINAKTQRPSVCNAMETLLVHESVADRWVPHITALLRERGVEIRACARSLGLLRGHGFAGVHAATEADWGTEYLALVMALRVVPDLDAAISHIASYGTRHSEAIVTEDQAAAERFLAEVDAAAVYHNASTRFTDGYEYGFGVEIGISTQKLHARGPMGLEELTSYKYVVRGQGQVRP